MKTIIKLILLFPIIFIGCKSDEINSLKNEVDSLKIELESCQVKIEYLYELDSINRENILKLVKQDNKTLGLIQAHLKYNHSYEIN